MEQVMTTLPPDPGAANGVPRQQLQDLLTDEPMSTGYRPTIPQWLIEDDWLPQVYLIRDIERMLVHPMVRNALNYFKGGISGAEFWGGKAPDNNPAGLPICIENPAVDTFVREQCNRYWDRGVPKVQGGYDYGWIGCEATYAEQQGMLCWDNLLPFSPRDTFLLTQDGKPVGVRVKNVRGKTKPVDLWTASQDVPAKGVWYAHDPRYTALYGQSQLFGAWRPWRRLGAKDGAETVIDTGVYRFAFPGPICRYPQEDLQTAQLGVPGTTTDSQGGRRRYARDMMRSIGEQAKAGATIGLPSAKYPPEQGGDYKYDLQWPEHTIDVSGLIVYAKWLQDQIYFGIGVSPELVQAAESGSGYSGRVIVLEAFLTMQQKIADALLDLFLTQILIPLVRWNFGPDVKWHVEVKSLLETKMNAKSGHGSGYTPEQMGQNGGAIPGQAPQNMPAENRDMMFSMNSHLVTDRVRNIARRAIWNAMRRAA